MSNKIDEILEAASTEARAACDDFKKRAAANAIPGMDPPPMSTAHADKFAREAVDRHSGELLDAFAEEVADAVSGEHEVESEG
jgi:hypothetical protein